VWDNAREVFKSSQTYLNKGRGWGVYVCGSELKFSQKPIERLSLGHP